MKQPCVMWATSMLLAAIMLACGGDSDRNTRSDLAAYFPDQIENGGLEKTSEIRTFVGDSLWEYIDGGAELYHTYGFVKVAAADYTSAGVELVMDLYQFGTAEGAYGLYSALRPEEPEIVDMGVEGYCTGSSLEVVKGEIMVRLVGFDETEATGAALRALARQTVSTLPGTTQPPAMFGQFPAEGALPHTDRIVGESFLGQGFLNMVYLRDYAAGADTLSLFLIDDAMGSTFAPWYEGVTDEERASSATAGMPFDENYALSTSNSYYGPILAGLKKGKLAGVINYSDRHKDFVADWLNSLQ